jgi:tetratricopeptide (TPR) repeat protein
VWTDDPAYFANRSLAKILTGDMNGAQQDIKAALKINPENAIAVYNSGIICRRSNDTVQAKAYFQQAITLEPALAGFYKQFGLDMNGPAANTAGNSSSGDLVNNAISKARSGDLQGALTDLNNAINMDAANSVAYRNRGNVKYDLKDFSGAIADAGRAIELSPGDALAYMIRAKSYFAGGDHQAACLDWGKAAELGNTKAGEMIAAYCR